MTHLGMINDHWLSLSTPFLDLLAAGLQSVLAPPRDIDCGTSTPQLEGNAAADAMTSTSHQAHLTSQHVKDVLSM